MDELKVFRDAQPELERWRLRQLRLEEPERGSELADDDKAFEFHRISQVVRVSLILAGEHLRLVWDGLQRGNLYTSAQHTAVRGGLVGAAQAVWITAPDDHVTRRRRGHAVIAESYEQLRKYHQRTLDLSTELGFTAEDEQQVREQIEWIKTRQYALAVVEPAPIRVNLADALRDIAPVVFPDDPLRQGGLRIAWNVLSSDAHALMGSVAARAVFAPARSAGRNGGLSIGVAGGQLGELAGWYDLAVHCLRRGWRLFDRRCEGE
ncbi:hypothetical protein [Amycolatopsis sp. ATCC 39116]|uniref:hypothetical protein n=1 Tax=Amycolatopsis sp. (strain ATCC 39116 / 75iv2) TaxID=385957 RepID=UPI0002625906|nr:hypothetical protein [Amycolatopsis sp. ATCC 39116]